MTVGTYRQVRLLGRGGMGVVHLGETADGTPVALKRLPLYGAAEEIDRARHRLRREAAVLRGLEHPGIVRLLDLIDDGDEIVIVMPYLAGGTLQDRVRRDGPLPAAEVHALADRLLGALAAAHRSGVIHRDITPANVLFDAEGLAYLTDFGVASTRDSTAGLTATTAVIGTPGFMAPERARGQPATAASDVFSLGATLAYAATGSGPFGVGDPNVLMWRASTGRVDRLPRELSPDLRRRLQPLLERTPALRPSAAEAAGGPQGTQAMPVLRSARRRLDVRSRPVAPVLTAVAVVAVVALLAVLASGVNNLDDGSPGAATQSSTVPCQPKPYQPCGEDPAPFTDGDRCTDDHGDYDGDARNGCEAEPDDLADPMILVDSARANLVPADDTDTFRFEISDSAQLFELCGGVVIVTLEGAPGVDQRLSVSLDGEPWDEAISRDGATVEIEITESCRPGERYQVTAEVSSVGEERTDQRYRISRTGSL